VKNRVGGAGSLATTAAHQLHQSKKQQALTPEFTANRYRISRREAFSALTAEHVNKFKSIVDAPEHNVLQEQHAGELDQYNVDWLKTVRGQSRCVLRPSTTEQVSEIMKYCNENNIAVCPQGGNTGLCGGSVPVFDEVVLSLERMNKILDIDTTTGIVQTESGVILEKLMHELAACQPPFIVPLDLGAKGSCQIGGNISTNAGGLRVIRYGGLHGSVLGLEVVLPSGKVLNVNSPLRKDNTGYDLKQLFIGAEGTLGIVTKATILCPNLPKSVHVAFFKLSSYEHVLRLFSLAKYELNEILSAFEFLDKDCREACRDNLKLENPFESGAKDSDFYVLLETSGSNSEHDLEKLSAFTELAMEQEIVEDGVIADDSAKCEKLWGLRERIAEAVNHDGYVYKYDVSIPLPKLYKCVEDLRVHAASALESGAITRITGYGHIGDGNLHINVTASEYSKEVLQILEPWVYDWVGDIKGSVSAEHGLGFKKPQFIFHSKSQDAVDTMKEIKRLFDPKGICNPYKMLPDE